MEPDNDTFDFWLKNLNLLIVDYKATYYTFAYISYQREIFFRNLKLQ